jgi:hypothetical protein
MGKTRTLEKLHRFRSLDPADKRLFLRAVGWLAVARVRLAVVPFARLAEQLSADAGSENPSPELLGRIGFAVSAAGANVPWRSDCFPQAIAAHQLLKRYWLTCGDTVVTGGAERDRYREIHRLGE